MTATITVKSQGLLEPIQYPIRYFEKIEEEIFERDVYDPGCSDCEYFGDACGEHSAEEVSGYYFVYGIQGLLGGRIFLGDGTEAEAIERLGSAKRVARERLQEFLATPLATITQMEVPRGTPSAPTG